MMQSDSKILFSPAWLLVVTVAVVVAGPLTAADRTTLLIPLPHDAQTGELPSGVFADEAFGDAASPGWKAYLRVWKTHYDNPTNAAVRRFLGLPLKESFGASVRRGRSAPRGLRWRAGSFQQVDTPHFVIYSRADTESSKRVAEDLERCYWVWTQMFFPLWEAGPQVASVLGKMSDGESVPDYLATGAGRITIRRKLTIVLFRDASEYHQSLRRVIPGIERSTGYYNDQNQITFLYASDTDDAATRRHEMVHQLFREATRSGLGRQMPGEDTGFWLIEGIAGYFESLFLADRFATLGGWDSSRLQFARYRILVGGDRMPMAELALDGRIAAQSRRDIARWYTHAIAQTHQLLDGSSVENRRWVYRELAERYKISPDLTHGGDAIGPPAVDRSIRDFLSIDDAHIHRNPAGRPLQELCLAGCRITDQGLGRIMPSPHLRWLDLGQLPIGNQAVRRLAPNPSSLEQVRLEATKIDADLVDWLSNAGGLRELDLSSTPVGDTVIEAVSAAGGLSILWMTGTQVSDRSIDAIAKMRRLQSVDLQVTKVTDAGIARLRAARPELEINPLELRSP